jgi:hypothetical protein
MGLTPDQWDCFSNLAKAMSLHGQSRPVEITEPCSVTLNPEIARLVRSYAEQEGIQKLDTAANELLRQALGAAA